MHKIVGAHLQCVNNHYAKFEYKGMKTVWVTDYTNQTHPKHLGWKKCLSSTPIKNEKIFMKCAQNGWCTSSMCEQYHAKFECKGKKMLEVTDYTNQTPSKHFWTEKCLSSTPFKNEEIFMKFAQNKRCTSSICEKSLCKVWIIRNENFWSYRLHKLGTPKVLRTDRQMEWTHY